MFVELWLISTSFMIDTSPLHKQSSFHWMCTFPLVLTATTRFWHHWATLLPSSTSNVQSCSTFKPIKFLQISGHGGCIHLCLSTIPPASSISLILIAPSIAMSFHFHINGLNILNLLTLYPIKEVVSRTAAPLLFCLYLASSVLGLLNHKSDSTNDLVKTQNLLQTKEDGGPSNQNEWL